MLSTEQIVIRLRKEADNLQSLTYKDSHARLMHLAADRLEKLSKEKK